MKTLFGDIEDIQSSGIIPRPYQSEFVAASIAAMQRRRTTLGVMATGLGKTVSFALVAQHYLQQGNVVVLAHRQELIEQAISTIELVTRRQVFKEMGPYHIDMESFKKKNAIVVSTFQSQYSGRDGDGRMTKFDPSTISLLVVDEAHHGVSAGFMAVIKYYLSNPNCHLLGVTATPDRADSKALGKLFNTVCYEYSIKDGINDGWLVPIRASIVHIGELDISEVSIVAGEFNRKELEEVLCKDKAVAAYAKAIIDKTKNNKTLVFCAGVTQAEKISEILNAIKPGSAYTVFGHTDKDIRPEIISMFRKSEFQYLIGVGVPTEGFDVPDIKVVAMCRPTKSRSLYTQMVGRGTRSIKGTIDGIASASDRRAAIATSDKPYMELLDFTGNSGKHKLVTSADILGGDYDDDVIHKAMKVAEKSKTPVEIDKICEKIDKEHKAKKLEEQRKKKHAISKLIENGKIMLALKTSETKIDPFNIFDLRADASLYSHDRGRTITDRQKWLLEKYNINTEHLDFFRASQVIAQLKPYLDRPSEKMINVLRRAKHPSPDTLDKREAGRLVGLLRNNGWNPFDARRKCMIWE